MATFWDKLKDILKTNAILLFLPSVVKEGFAAIPTESLKAELVVPFWEHKTELVALSAGTPTPIDDTAVAAFDIAARQWLAGKDPKFSVLPDLLDEFVEWRGGQDFDS